MIIRDPYFRWTLVGPLETDPILIIDSNTVLPPQIPAQRLQPIARRDAEIIETLSRIELVQLALRHRPKLSWTSGAGRLRVLPVENVLRPLVREGPDHVHMIARLPCYKPSNTAVQLQGDLR